MTKPTNTGENNSGTFDMSTGYMVKRHNGVKTTLHRIVIGAKKGDIVDHINGIKTDNRIENLRLVTKSQNNRNRKNVKGYAVTPNGRYQVTTTYNDKTYYVGTYDDPVTAQLVHKAVSKFAFEVTDELTKALKNLRER